MDHPLPWLRYVDADDLEGSSYKFDGMEVRDPSGDKLGKVDGFVVDSVSGQPYYVAVDAGGWFKSKLFLLPIGHAGFDSSQVRLVSDVSRERVDRFPGFDRHEFGKLSEDELRRMDEVTLACCCPSEMVDEKSATSRFDHWTHYRSPNWWDGSFVRPDRADDTLRSFAGTSEPSIARDSKSGKKRR